MLPGEQCSVIGPRGSRPSHGQGPERHRRLAGGDSVALGVLLWSVAHATLTAFAFEHPATLVPRACSRHRRCPVQGGGRRTPAWGMQSTAVSRLQQLTSVISSDFRISRKSPEETVRLLQREGKASPFFCRIKR